MVAKKQVLLGDMGDVTERCRDAAPMVADDADAADGIFLSGTYPNDPASGPAFDTDMCARLGRRKLLTSLRYVTAYGRMSIVG